MENAFKIPDIPVPSPRTPVAENEIREMDDDERSSGEMSSKPCLQCLEEKPALFKMIRNNEMDYFCCPQCTTDFKAASSLCDVLTITQKRTSVVRYPLTVTQNCIGCESTGVVCQ